MQVVGVGLACRHTCSQKHKTREAHLICVLERISNVPSNEPSAAESPLLVIPHSVCSLCACPKEDHDLWVIPLSHLPECLMPTLLQVMVFLLHNIQGTTVFMIVTYPACVVPCPVSHALNRVQRHALPCWRCSACKITLQ